jgi:hypothetical protein
MCHAHNVLLVASLRSHGLLLLPLLHLAHRLFEAGRFLQHLAVSDGCLFQRLIHDDWLLAGYVSKSLVMQSVHIQPRRRRSMVLERPADSNVIGVSTKATGAPCIARGGRVPD